MIGLPFAYHFLLRIVKWVLLFMVIGTSLILGVQGLVQWSWLKEARLTWDFWISFVSYFLVQSVPFLISITFFYAVWMGTWEWRQKNGWFLIESSGRSLWWIWQYLWWIPAVGSFVIFLIYLSATPLAYNMWANQKRVLARQQFTQILGDQNGEHLRFHRIPHREWMIQVLSRTDLREKTWSDVFLSFWQDGSEEDVVAAHFNRITDQESVLNVEGGQMTWFYMPEKKGGWVSFDALTIDLVELSDLLFPLQSSSSNKNLSFIDLYQRWRMQPSLSISLRFYEECFFLLFPFVSALVAWWLPLSLFACMKLFRLMPFWILILFLFSKMLVLKKNYPAFVVLFPFVCLLLLIVVERRFFSLRSSE